MNVFHAAALVLLTLAVLGLIPVLFTLTLAHALALIAAALICWMIAGLTPWRVG